MCGICGKLVSCGLGIQSGLSSFRLNGVKWGDDTFGTSGGTVTWSAAAFNFPEQPFSFESSLGGDFLSQTREAFDSWESIADIDFVEVTDGQDVDIRLGFAGIDGPSGTLAEAFFSFIGSTLVSSSIRFDTAEAYVGGNVEDGSGNVNFKTVAIHEIGHAIGLGHSTADTAIMRAFIDPDVNDLQQDDIDAVQAVYGGSSTTTTTTNMTSGTDFADTLIGSSSGDTIRGGSGADVITGLAGNDVIYGNKETDTIFGNEGSDTIFGGQNNGPETTNNGISAKRTGADLLDGGAGMDLIYGNHGGDLIIGGDGDDTVFAGQDNDTISGGSGNDLIQGNKNDDLIIGGSGNDTLVGGGGSDKFQFSSDSGNDVITDDFFRLLFDKIEIKTNINGTGVSSGTDMLPRIMDSDGGQAVIDLGDGNTITFQGVSASFFISSDFEFF